MNRELCEKKAEEARLQYNPNSLSPFPHKNVEAGNRDLVIDVFPFSNLNGEAEQLREVSGVIFFHDETKVYNIYVNSDKPSSRQHFTVAHELGHYFLHKDFLQTNKAIIDTEFFDGNRAFFRNDTSASNDRETEANCFAAALIMPEALVRQAWRDLKSIEECARIFNVSASAMSIRLERLRLLSV